MARIAGVNLPKNKVVQFALASIYGIGPNRAKVICSNLSIPQGKRTYDLTGEEVNAIRSFIEKNYEVEGELRTEVSMNIKRLIDSGAYRGVRHRSRLPVRGQRTHTNARTRKGKSVAIPGKKK